MLQNTDMAQKKEKYNSLQYNKYMVKTLHNTALL